MMSKFQQHKRAVELGGTPYVTIEASREYPGSISLPVVGADWSGDSVQLNCRVSITPGVAAVVILPVTVTVEQHTWQEYKDLGIPDHYFPSNVMFEDIVDVSLVNITWSANEWDGVSESEPDVIGDPVIMYFEIVRTDLQSGLFIAGEFIITGTTQ